MGRGKAKDKLKGEKFQMSPSEIVQMYKEAKEKRSQIKILAELNLCTQDEIKAILREGGIRLPGGVKQVEKVNGEVPKEVINEPKAETFEQDKDYSNVKDLKRIEELEAQVKQLKTINEELEDEARTFLGNLAEIESLVDILNLIDLKKLESFTGVELLLRQIKGCCTIF